MPDDPEPSSADALPLPLPGVRSVHLGALIERLAPDRNPAGTVYGTITVGVLLAAEASRAETYARTVEAISVALLLYWLAHGYAHVVGLRISDSRRWTLSSLAKALGTELAIVRGGLIPLVAVLCSWIAGDRLSLGINVGVYVAAGVLVIIELIAGVRSELRSGEIVFQTFVGAVFALGIISLRAVLH